MPLTSIPPITAHLPAPASATQARPAAVADAARKAEALQQFEAFVLQSFIEAMLPKDAENVYGKGAAGQIWKSMLAEKLAVEIARRGDLGIAASIAGDVASVTESPANKERR